MWDAVALAHTSWGQDTSSAVRARSGPCLHVHGAHGGVCAACVCLSVVYLVYIVAFSKQELNTGAVGRERGGGGRKLCIFAVRARDDVCALLPTFRTCMCARMMKDMCGTPFAAVGICLSVYGVCERTRVRDRHVRSFQACFSLQRVHSAEAQSSDVGHPHQKKKQLYYNEDGGRGAGEVGVDDDWVQGLYDMEGMSGDTA